MHGTTIERGVRYGMPYEHTSTVDALAHVMGTLAGLDVGEALILPYRLGEDTSILRSRLETLSLEGFGGLVIVCVIGVANTDDALFASLTLRDVLDCPELSTLTVMSCERSAEVAKALLLGDFSELD